MKARHSTQSTLAVARADAGSRESAVRGKLAAMAGAGEVSEEKESPMAAIDQKRISENHSAWSIHRGSLVTIMGNTMTPRDPNEDEDEDEGEDEHDEDRHDEPAVIREPDE
jgi:hypothetical protein